MKGRGEGVKQLLVGDIFLEGLVTVKFCNVNVHESSDAIFRNGLR